MASPLLNYRDQETDPFLQLTRASFLPGGLPAPQLPVAPPAPPQDPGFLQRVASDPALQMALLTFAGGAMQPVGPEQTGLGVLGASLANSVDFLQRQRNAERELGVQERRADVLEADVAQRGESARATQEHRAAELEQRKAEADVEAEVKDAQATYYNARTRKLKFDIEQALKNAKTGVGPFAGILGPGIKFTDLSSSLQEITSTAQAMMKSNPSLSPDQAWLMATDELQVKGPIYSSIANAMVQNAMVSGRDPVQTGMQVAETVGVQQAAARGQEGGGLVGVGKEFDMEGGRWRVQSEIEEGGIPKYIVVEVNSGERAKVAKSAVDNAGAGGGAGTSAAEGARTPVPFEAARYPTPPALGSQGR